jgi:hypothetical protein
VNWACPTVVRSGRAQDGSFRAQDGSFRAPSCKELEAEVEAATAWQQWYSGKYKIEKNVRRFIVYEI